VPRRAFLPLIYLQARLGDDRWVSGRRSFLWGQKQFRPSAVAKNQRSGGMGWPPYGVDKICFAISEYLVFVICPPRIRDVSIQRSDHFGGMAGLGGIEVV
jgi:hypothetical protein